MTGKTLREAALDIIEADLVRLRGSFAALKAIEALRAAIALPDEPVACKPLTREQISAEFEQGNHYFDCAEACFGAGVEFAETHHNIKGVA